MDDYGGFVEGDDDGDTVGFHESKSRKKEKVHGIGFLFPEGKELEFMLLVYVGLWALFDMDTYQKGKGTEDGNPEHPAMGLNPLSETETEE